MAEMMKDDEAPTTPTRDDRIPLPPPGAVPPSFVEQDFGVPPPPAQTLGDLQHEGGLETGEQKEKAEGGEEDEMIRLRRAAAAQRESLPLLHPTPDINAGPPSYTPPATTSPNPPSFLLTSGYTETDAGTPSSSTPFSTSITASSSRKRDVVRPPPPVERIPSSTSDDFGEFVDAPPSAAVPALEGGMDPLTPDYVGAHDDPLQFTSLQDPLQPTTVQDPLSSLNPDVSAQRPPPPPLDPLSLPSQPQPQPHAQSHPRAPWSASPSSSPLLPPTPSLGSPAPPPPPKSARPPTNLVDEVLRYEEGGLSLFSAPQFHSASSSCSGPAPPAPPPKSPTPIPPPPPHREWNSRTATPTPSSATGIAYAGGVLSPTPLHPPTLTPPTTAAAHPSGAFRDHPLAPTPGSRPRTPPKVTTPHLGVASLAASSASSSSATKPGAKANGKGKPMGVEEKLKHATSPHAETEIIAHHLGLIDDDYFSSREPADASALAIPVPRELSRSRSRSEKGGGLVGSLGGLLSGGGGVGAGGAGGAGVARGREGRGGETAGGEAGREGVSRGREPSPVQTRAAPPVMTSGGEWDWGDESTHGHHHHPPSSPRRTSSSSSSATLGGLWGLWKGASPSPHGHGLDDHAQQHGLSASPQPVPPTIVEGQPASFDFGDRSSNSSVERQGEDEYGSVGVQGRSGRPLPKARTSLESIQQRWMDHGGRPPSHHAQGYSPITTPSSSSPAGHRDLGGLGVPTSSRGKSRTPSPSRARKEHVRIDPPTITHVSPFAPPPPPPNSAIFASSGLNAGFGDPMAVAGGLLSSSISSSTSCLGLGRGSGGLLGALAGAGGSASANPFGSHTFVPIAGAPGFRPEGYDWDKGFSEELERELSVASPPQTATPTRESFGASELARGKGDGAESGAEKRYADEKTYGVRERGRQPRNQQEKEPSIYQTIGSKFGLWGSSSSSSTPSSSSTSSSSSAFNTVPTSREKEFGGYNGHGRSATTPSYSYSSAGQGKWGDGGGVERRVINGKKVGELIERKVGGVELKARKESTVGVLGRGVGDKLRPHLPPLSRLPRTWTLLYSMDQHGISLNTLYTLCEAPEKNRRPTQPYVGMGGHILVIRDDASETDKESCFGAYIADGLSRSKAKGFYGGGDSFLFKYHAPSDTLSVFHPTGRNTYYALCESGYMAFGGGNGGSGYALWVSEDLLEGSSASRGPGGTFGNEVLCFGGTRKRGKEGQEVEVELEVVGLEVWGVGPT